MAEAAPGLNPGARERKRALIEVIELQRKLMQQRDETPVGDEAEEVAWYAEQTKRLDRFKQALNALRLESDEFVLRVPCEWMQPTARRARGTVECTLRVNAQSQMTFVPSAAGGSPGNGSGGGGGSSSRELSAEDAALASAAGRPRVFFIDELRSVRCEAPTTAGGAATSSSSSSPQPTALVLSWRQQGGADCTLRCSTAEATELSEVLGLHLRRYNQSRVATAQRLTAVHALKCTPYSSTNEEHEELLRRLWACGFPGVEFKHDTCRVTTDWIRIGFQGADPATDFRGMGVLGLHNLLYFGEHFPDVFTRLVNAQRKRDYPLACAGINVTFMLLEMLKLTDDVQAQQQGGEGSPDVPNDAVQRRPPFDAAWESDMFRFFCQMFYRDRPFEDMYCFALRTLDRIFVSLDADYADFPSVVAVLRSKLQEALAQRPLSFREFKRLVAQADGDGTSDTRSSHSHDTGTAGGDGEGGGAAAERDLSRLLGDLPQGLSASLKGLGSLFGQAAGRQSVDESSSRR